MTPTPEDLRLWLEEVEGPRDRIAEFVRQYDNPGGLHPDVIHTVWFDSDAEKATITRSDLVALIKAADRSAVLVGEVERMRAEMERARLCASLLFGAHQRVSFDTMADRDTQRLALIEAVGCWPGVAAAAAALSPSTDEREADQQ